MITYMNLTGIESVKLTKKDKIINNFKIMFQDSKITARMGIEPGSLDSEADFLST